MAKASLFRCPEPVRRHVYLTKLAACGQLFCFLVPLQINTLSKYLQFIAVQVLTGVGWVGIVRLLS